MKTETKTKTRWTSAAMSRTGKALHVQVEASSRLPHMHAVIVERAGRYNGFVPSARWKSRPVGAVRQAAVSVETRENLATSVLVGR